MLHSAAPNLKLFLNSVPHSPTPRFTYATPVSLPRKCHRHLKPRAIITPSSRSQPSNPQQPYQPFRPPPSPLPPQYRNLDPIARLEILANRLGLWHEYTPLISSLLQEGFTPPTVEEATGISGVEQNRLIVAAQVRESLIQSNADPEILAAFDTSGSELLYEIRLVSASQRAAAAKYIVENGFDTKGAQELARAMKDYPKRRGDKCWESFDYNIPGDCLSFMYFRQSREHQLSSGERISTLEQALKVAISEKAIEAVTQEMELNDKGSDGDDASPAQAVKVPVVRMNFGEVAEAKSVAVLPVCYEKEELLEAPWECGSKGDFGVVVADKEWRKWVAVPRWAPLLNMGNGVAAVAFGDATALPWKMNKRDKKEAILAVVDRAKKEVDLDDGFYLVVQNDVGEGLKVEKGSVLKEKGVAEALAMVMLVLRPPKDDDDQIRDEEWD